MIVSEAPSIRTSQVGAAVHSLEYSQQKKGFILQRVQQAAKVPSKLPDPLLKTGSEEYSAVVHPSLKVPLTQIGLSLGSTRDEPQS